jgi:thioredoxin reductase (NADPH)
VARILSTKNIGVLTNTELTGLEGDEIFKDITLTNPWAGQQKFPTRWVFVCIGDEPNTEWAKEADSGGYIVRYRGLLKNANIGIPCSRFSVSSRSRPPISSL